LSIGILEMLIRFARKTIQEGKTVAWPFWTCLWGYLITLPFVLLVFVFDQLLKNDNLREWEIALFSTLEIAAMMPIAIHYLVGATILSILWIVLLVSPLVKMSAS